MQPVQVHLLPHGDVTERQDLKRGHRATVRLRVRLKGFRQLPRHPSPHSALGLAQESQQTLPAGVGDGNAQPGPRLASSQILPGLLLLLLWDFPLGPAALGLLNLCCRRSRPLEAEVPLNLVPKEPPIQQRDGPESEGIEVWEQEPKQKFLEEEVCSGS